VRRRGYDGGMRTFQLVLATLVLPGLWGWIIGACGHRWWRAGERTGVSGVPEPRRFTDYDI